MPQIPDSIYLRTDEMERAKAAGDVKAFMEAALKAFRELESQWKTVWSDIGRAE